MGHLYFFNLPHLIQQYNARAFVETGTGFGFGVHHASQFPFNLIVSVEILAAEVERLRPPFADDKRIHLIAGQSPTVLRQVLPQIQSPIIFWLDAHFPGAHHHEQSYDATAQQQVRLPLESELQVIKELRPDGKDVILIDDLRIYEQDNFQYGNLSDLGLSHVAKYNTTFLYTMFADTHHPQRFLQHTGYLALLPKQLAMPTSANPAP
jgi:hypothetical protein